MTFEELLKESCALAGLPNTAPLCIPQCLSEKTKKMAAELSPAQLAEVLKAAVDRIERGSVRRLEELIPEEINLLKN